MAWPGLLALINEPCVALTVYPKFYETTILSLHAQCSAQVKVTQNIDNTMLAHLSMAGYQADNVDKSIYLEFCHTLTYRVALRKSEKGKVTKLIEIETELSR